MVRVAPVQDRAPAVALTRPGAIDLADRPRRVPLPVVLVDPPLALAAPRCRPRVPLPVVLVDPPLRPRSLPLQPVLAPTRAIVPQARAQDTVAIAVVVMVHGGVRTRAVVVVARVGMSKLHS